MTAQVHNYRQLFAIIKALQTKGIDLTKEDIVFEFTQGRTESASAMSKTEFATMINTLNARLNGNETTPVTRRPVDDPLNKQRNRLLSVFHDLSAAKPEVWGRYITAAGKANVPAIMEMINATGCVKKPSLNEFDRKELSQLIAQFENILKKEYGKGKA